MKASISLGYLDPWALGTSRAKPLPGKLADFLQCLSCTGPIRIIAASLANMRPTKYTILINDEGARSVGRVGMDSHLECHAIHRADEESGIGKND